MKKIVGAPDCALRIRQNKSIEVSLRVSFADPRPSLTVFTLLILLAGTTSGSTSEDPRIDPGLVVTADECAECHQAAFEQWKTTRHAIGFDTEEKVAKSEEIADKMGVRLIRRDSPCLNCHYTAKPRGDQLRSVSGVSCESCHGAAKEWVEIHGNYGGQDLDRSTETAEHRDQRIAAVKAAGMIRPSDGYSVVENCFQCHIVNNEALVNVGGHSPGSTFELLSRREEIRHNFLESSFDDQGTENAAFPIESSRVMYVVGRALDLELSLRAAAAAEENGNFFRFMSRRVRAAVSEIQAISEVVEVPEIDEILAAAVSRPRQGEVEVLTNAADSIAKITRSFASSYDGSQLSGLDSLIQSDQGATD